MLKVAAGPGGWSPKTSLTAVGLLAVSWLTVLVAQSVATRFGDAVGGAMSQPA